MSFTYYQEKIVQPGSDIYYSLLFTPEAKKTAAVALYSFEYELQNITECYKEKNLAEIKLQWWKQEWQRMLQQKAQHPLAIALQPFSTTLPLPLLEEWVDGALVKLDSDHLCTEEDLSFFCYREVGIRTILLAHILGYTEHRSLKGVQDLAEVIALLFIINHREHHIKKGQFFLPLIWLEQHKITVEDLNSLIMTPAMTELFKQALAKAEQKLQTGLQKIAKEDEASLLPIMIEATLAVQTLKKMAKKNFKLPSSLLPLTKLFIAYSLYFKKA